MRNSNPLRIGKATQMDFYDGTTDLNEHIENIEVVLTYRSVGSAVKCKLFVATLRQGAVTGETPSTHGVTSATSSPPTSQLRGPIPKIVASLEAIVRGKSEPLRDYIERFNKEGIQVRGADENMK
jgi:hypothetical protein